MKINGKPDGGGGGGVITSLTATNNGTYNAPVGIDGYNPVKVNVSGGGITPEEQAALDTLVDSSDGVLYTRILEKNKVYIISDSNLNNIDYSCFLYNIDGDIYFMPYSQLYKLNKDDFSFELICSFDGSSNQAPIWKDLSGRWYRGVESQLDFTNNQFVNVSLNCTNYSNSLGSNRHTIWKGQYGVYSIGAGIALKFDEDLQQFVSYTLTGAGNTGSYYIGAYGFWYDGHYIYFNGSDMFELKEFEDHLEIELLSTNYFPTTIDGNNISSGYIISTSSNLYYGYWINSYKLVDGEWVEVVFKYEDGNSFMFRQQEGRGVVLDDYMIGYESQAQSCVYTLINTSNTEKTTYWVNPGQVAVDINSYQKVFGHKDFKGGVTTEQLAISNLYKTRNETTFILGKNTTNADKISFNVTGNFTLNGYNIATTQDCIMNRTHIPYGGIESFVIQDNHEPYLSAGTFITNTGRMFYVPNSDTVLEFDGTQWNTVPGGIGVNTNIPGNNVKIAGSKTFFLTTSGTYLWDDANSQFTLITNDIPGTDWWVWPCGDGVLRYSYNKKLVENNGTWSWIDDNVPGYIYGMTHYVNGHVYVLNNFSEVYEYVESTKTYTKLGIYHRWSDNSFVCNDEIFFFYNNTDVYKLDLSLVSSDTNAYIDTVTNVPYTNNNYFYGEYDDKLYFYKGYGQLYNCYGVDEELPEVPSENGTYILQAVRTNSGVTYSWVSAV